jgi:hypothetical protein
MPEDPDALPAAESTASAPSTPPVPASNGWPGVSSGGNGGNGGNAIKTAPPTEPVAQADAGKEQLEVKPPAFDPDAPSRRVTVKLTPTGDRERDKAKLVRAHTILTAYPGNDHFDFLLSENNQQYQMDFPNQPTNICDDMLITLKLLVGEENITIHEAA